MEIQEIIGQLKDKFGDKLDIEKIKEHLNDMDFSKISNISQILPHLKDGGFLGDLDGDGVKEGLLDELKGKAEDLFGKMFKK